MAAEVEVELNARVVALISSRELDTLGDSISASTDVDVEAMDIELRARILRGGRAQGIAVQGEQLSSEDIHTWLNIARQLESVGSVVVEEILIRPLA